MPTATGPTAIPVRSVTVRTAPFSANTWLDSQRISTPLAPFPRFSERRSSWRGPGSDVVWVHIGTEDPAVFGIGQARGGAVIAALLTEHLRDLLVGQDVREVARLTAELGRVAQPYAAGGAVAMATSAVDLALWDAAARAAGVPLYRMLGGSPGPLPYYLTAADASVDLPADLLPGAAYVKVPMPYGPADGPTNVARNVEVLAAVRERVPAEVPLAVDCFMSWDVPTAVAFARAAADLGLGWIEEPLAPDDLDGHQELRRAITPVRVASGEHAFGLRAGLDLLNTRSVDVLQTDVTWCGGLRIAQTLATVAGAHGVTFAPHASALQPWALHLLAATGPGCLAEIMVGLGPPAGVPAPSEGPGVGIDPGDAGF
ncbi:enolase C-terminal domain-like protein [Occultella gossypii]|uniref:Mandelate racemase/muconate lactonizing enzyme C-terminal domain-containing protein n=1 Tax=Occultella gossypii TaxID=2800820 RepID=A0ABS7SAQ0_9MICO|nr:enolase C-terminal domain-like protein [Occultella gossypii]MBZ2197172.1 hypothetical protein [Occultella gossypii]